MKFGGAAVADLESFSSIVKIVLKRSRDFDKIVIVVSAMSNMTDQLISLANAVNPHPPTREYDMLISVGERISMALLAMAFDVAGIQAAGFTGSQSGIITTTDHSSARIIDLRPQRLSEALEARDIVIVAGFQGVSVKKDITTLGRGGSDTSAVALGIALEAEGVEFYKDVRGVYKEDPKKNPEALLFRNLSYSRALNFMKGARPILHPRSVILAQKNNIPLTVRSFIHQGDEGTKISAKRKRNPKQKIYEEHDPFRTLFRT